MLKNSKYNFYLQVPGGGVIYNANSGAAIQFSGRDGVALCRELCNSEGCFELGQFPEKTLNRLRRGGFLLQHDEDELATVRERYWRARAETPIVLTITTTQDCNLGCYYCYESRSKDALTSGDLPWLVDIARARLQDSGQKSLHVDWYGGEPLMNEKFMEDASFALQEMCRENDASYIASVISNGTCWPEDAAAFVQRHRIRQIQISFDGLRANHNKRRRYRTGYTPDSDASSFDEAANLVDHLLLHTKIDLRFNIDRGNQDDVIPFIDAAERRGWFDSLHPVTLQLARLSRYSERSDFMRQSELTPDEFDRLRRLAEDYLPSDSLLDKDSSAATYPLPRTSVCAALASYSAVIGAEGHEYRCGLQVGETHRATGIRSTGGTLSKGPDADWWDRFDPTKAERCSVCSFLPVCWGGCPKSHLEQDHHALDEQSLYWRKMLPRKIAHRFGFKPPDEFAFSEADQFRSNSNILA